MEVGLIVAVLCLAASTAALASSVPPTRTANQPTSGQNPEGSVHHRESSHDARAPATAGTMMTSARTNPASHGRATQRSRSVAATSPGYDGPSVQAMAIGRIRVLCTG